MVGELAKFVGIECGWLKGRALDFEAVEVRRVELFESTDERLHVEFSVDFVATEISEADFDFITEFSSFLFGLRNTSFVAFGNFWTFRFGSGATFRRFPKCAKDLKNVSCVNTCAEDTGFATILDLLNPSVSRRFVPIVGDWAGDDLNPELLVMVCVEFGECTGDACERVDFERIEGFNWESAVFSQGKFSGVNDSVLVAVVDVVFVHFVDLDGWVLGINLALDERLKDFWHPYIKTNLSLSGDDFETEVFLNATRVFEFVFVAENTVERSEKLLSGELFFVVRAWDFEHEKHGVDVQDLELVGLFVVSVG